MSSQKGQKADGKGKAKESPVKTCFTCGKPGHMAKDCWRVARQVEASSTLTQAETSSTTNSSQTTATKAQPIKRIAEVSRDVSQEFNHDGV